MTANFLSSIEVKNKHCNAKRCEILMMVMNYSNHFFALRYLHRHTFVLLKKQFYHVSSSSRETSADCANVKNNMVRMTIHCRKVHAYILYHIVQNSKIDTIFNVNLFLGEICEYIFIPISFENMFWVLKRTVLLRRLF